MMHEGVGGNLHYVGVGADGPAVPPAKSEYDALTLRAVVLGLLIGTVTTLENVYFALKYG